MVVEVAGVAGEAPGPEEEPAGVVSSGTDPIVGDRSPQHFT
jgi:hypothetical protein